MEQYVKKPAAVQVFALNGATDIILRKDIASEKITDEEGNKQTVWNCDERQIRVASAVTEERSHGGLRFVVGLSAAARG